MGESKLLTLQVTCHLCFGMQEIRVPEDGLRKWRDGELIQTALPMITKAEREMLMSHTCDRCFEKLFKEFVDEGR